MISVNARGNSRFGSSLRKMCSHVPLGSAFKVDRSLLDRGQKLVMEPLDSSGIS